MLLSVTTGLVDAVSVLGLGKVFTANMTGNIVFLGFAVAGAPGFDAGHCFLAITAFLVGAALGGRVGKAHVGRSLRRWLLTSALIETVLLWLGAAFAVGLNRASAPSEPDVYAVIALTALAMGYRNATIRQLKVPDLTTTVLTLTLTGLAADSGLAGGGSPNRARRLGAVAAIFAGAALGALLIIHAGLAIPLALCGGLVLAGTFACVAHPAAAMPAHG
ncbi:YoaK family protein [Phenylobacterium sp.]|uniref:YoaK family protein n=1 Tax=Phenylobacterium sp. TaxID=1871053 RepID=UPI002E2F681E|nr:YoaK family protein [Phenylobacterium sp.]HEX3364151.1 YoaK family protein [Phenylobacterium sp.]